VFKVKVAKDGPYLVWGGVPLAEQKACVDRDQECHGWQEGQEYPVQDQYALCRCGRSSSKPFCDGTLVRAGFDGTEQAEDIPYLEQAVTYEGPGINLTDAEGYCAAARFCHRGGGTWNLVGRSDEPDVKQMIIEESCDCPAGRLVAWEKDGRAHEPDLEPSIGLVEDAQKGKAGPLWVRGGIPVESAEGVAYETRNRVTLCRCGRSSNKPFCDGSHLDE
jgi:CDGSH-type Zn-finger protein